MSDEQTPPIDAPDASESTSSFLASLGLGQLAPDDQQPNQTRTPAYRRVSTDEAAQMLRLQGEGLTAQQIAVVLERDPTTVYATLKKFEDTTEAARKYLHGQALSSAETLVELHKPGVNDRVRMESATKVLETVGIAPSGDSKGHSVQVAVVIGGPAHPPNWVKP